jgi:hypothetical protein
VYAKAPASKSSGDEHPSPSSAVTPSLTRSLQNLLLERPSSGQVNVKHAAHDPSRITRATKA